MESATCIVALSHKGKIWMGGDSVAMEPATSDILVLKNYKVFKKCDGEHNTFLIGFSGPYRLGQILQYSLCMPTIEAKHRNDMLWYIVVNLIPAIQQCLHDGGFEQNENGQLMLGGRILIGVLGQIFEIGKRYSVQELELQYAAIGCGAPFALGSLYSTANTSPIKRLYAALEAAEQFSGGVLRPFQVITT